MAEPLFKAIFSHPRDDVYLHGAFYFPGARVAANDRCHGEGS